RRPDRSRHDRSDRHRGAVTSATACSISAGLTTLGSLLPTAYCLLPMEFICDYSTPSGRFAIVAARFNGLVTEALLAGCRDAFVRHGVPEDQIDVAWVPGA